MKLTRIIMLALSVAALLLTIFPATILAADAARVAGDLKVGGIHLTTDGSVIRKLSDLSSPWTISNLDIYYLVPGGKVGIGMITPSTTLDVNGTVNATQFSGNGAGLTNVTASSIADGSVTDAKVSGTISSDKLDLSTVQKKYGKVAVVAQSGGDFTSPVAAMVGLASWCGTPSASNPCLVKIMPGVFALGTSSLTMQQYVDIEGSGENTTTISSAVSTTSQPSNGVVNGASHAEIRFLTVNNTGAGSNLAAMVNINGASPKMTNVTVIASGGTSINWGVFNDSASPTMTNVAATATGVGAGASNYGVSNYNFSGPVMTNVTANGIGGNTAVGIVNAGSSSPVMNNVSATASGGATTNVGVYNDSKAVMTNVTVLAGGGVNTYGVHNFSSSSAVMTNVIVTASGGPNTRGVYNESALSSVMRNVTIAASGTTIVYGVLNESTPIIEMNNVTVTESEGVNTNRGVYNYNSSPVMINVTVNASGGGNVYGVSNVYNCSPVMTNVITAASGGLNSYGVYNDASMPSMTNVTASGANASNGNYGLYSTATSGSYTVRIDRSTFTGASSSITKTSHFTHWVGATKLVGAVGGAGSITCINVYNGSSYAALNSTCQ